MNPDLRYHDIPEEALNAARTLWHHGAMQGWSGPTRDKPWSLDGMGPTTILQDRINTLELQLGKASIENATLRRLNIEASREASIQATKLHEASRQCETLNTAWRQSTEEWREHGRQADLRTARAKKERDAARADRDNEAARADQLKKDYDDDRNQHWKSLEHFRAAEENVRMAICALGLSPAHHPTLNDAIRGARELTQALRNDLANPPADVQELVLTKLGIMDGTCQLKQDSTGRMTITAATDVFPVSKACLQRLVDQHNKSIDLEQAIAEIRSIVNPKQPSTGTP